MTSPDRPTIFLALRPGPGARFVLRTDIFGALRSQARVVVLTPVFDVEYMAGLINDPEVSVLPIVRVTEGRIRRLSRARLLVQKVRRLALDGRKSVRYQEKYDTRMTGWYASQPRLARICDHFIRHGLWRSRLLRRLAVWVAVRAGPLLHDELFDRHRPALLVTTGLGYDLWDEGILQEAVRRGVNTAAVVHNWDNPTTGGYRAAPFDMVVAWSPRMRQQLIELQDVPSRRIRVAGVPHWDVYVRPTSLLSKTDLSAHIGFEPNEQYILHATHRPRTEVAAVDFASSLAELTATKAFGQGIGLVIRVHPMFMTPGQEDGRAALLRLAEEYEGVHVTLPLMASGKYVDVAPDDSQLLGALLKHSAVVVNVFSTTTLEAFLLDRPVVVAAPEAHLTGPASGSGRPALDWTDYAHLQSIVTTSAVPIVRTRDDLVREIRRSLVDPDAGLEVRRSIARDECGPADGHSGRRTGEHLLEAAVRGQDK